MEFKDNSPEFLEKMDRACEKALNDAGLQAVSYAKTNITEGVPRNGSGTSTGALRNSMTHEVRMDEQCVIVGTNVKYAIYNEYGTGVYADGGGGKQGYWVYVPGSSGGTGTPKVYTEAEARRIVAIMKSKGLDAHMTKGMKALHFLKNAIEDHRDEYKSIISDGIKAAAE